MGGREGGREDKVIFISVHPDYSTIIISNSALTIIGGIDRTLNLETHFLYFFHLCCGEVEYKPNCSVCMVLLIVTMETKGGNPHNYTSIIRITRSDNTNYTCNNYVWGKL